MKPPALAISLLACIAIAGCGSSNTTNKSQQDSTDQPCVVRQSDGTRLCGDDGRAFCQVADQTDSATLRACAQFDVGATKNPACSAYEPGDGAYEDCMRKNGLD